MPEIAKLWATIGADVSGFERGMSGARSAIGGFEATMQAAQNTVSTAMKVVSTAAAVMGGAVAATGIKFNAMKEQADIAFTTMLGSGQAAQAMLDDLQEFAAKTPFEFEDLTRAAQRLMAMGFAATEVKPLMTAVGDAVAALGGGSAEIDRVTTALGQMNAKGKTSAEEMMQLTEAGIPAWQMLADKIGVTVPEAMAMVTKGAIDARTTITAVTEGIEERFGGMMEAQSTTFNGMISNLRDNFSMLSGTVMKPFFDMAKSGLSRLVEITSSAEFTAGVERLAKRFGELADKMSAGIEQGIEWATRVLPPLWEKMTQIGEAIRTLIAPIAEAIGKFISWKDVLAALGIIAVGALASIVASMAPVIATIAAISAAIAALRWAWENDFASIRTTTQSALQKISDWFFKESGIWKGSWEKTLEYLSWWANGGWKTNVLAPLSIKLEEMRMAVRHWVLATKAGFEGWLKDTGQGIDHGLSVVASYFKELSGNIVASVTHWTSLASDKIGDWIRLRLQDIRLFIQEWGIKFKDLKDDTIKRFEGVLDWFKANEWIQKGRQIIQGLWDGLRDKWNDLSSWFSGVWKDLTNRFKAFFGIHSPSRLFEGYGDNMMQGLVKGIEGTRGAVFDAMDGLSAGLTSNVNVGAGDLAFAGAASNAPASDPQMAENNMLLRQLIAALQAKNMSPNITVQGGGRGDDLSQLVGATAGLRI